nr:hypothetical protein [Tanacetum cinerariifolium]
MADQRTMAELLHAPTKGYAEAILVPLILAEQFELKHSLINMMISDQFFGLEKDNTHDHIRCDANSNSSFEIAKLTHAVNQQTSAVTTAMTAILKQFQATPPPASIKACLAADSNTFPELRDNIQGYVAAAAVNYNQGNSVYRPLGSGSLPSNTIDNPKGELKSITTRSGIVLDGPSIPIPPPFINQEEDERVEETLTDPDLAEDPLHPNIPYPSRMLKQRQQEKDEVQIHKFWQMFKQLHINITLADALILILKYQKMLKTLLSNKEKLQELANTPLNENCSAFTFPADFVIVDYESDPRVPLILGRPFLRTARALIDVHGEEMILRDGDERLSLNMRHDTSSYSSQPQKESINMINICDDSNEDFLKNLSARNYQSGNPTFPSHLKLTSPKVKDDVFDSDCMLKPLFLSPIPVEDRKSFLEKSDTSLSYSDMSLPEFETFIIHTEETNSGSTTTRADYSLPKYDLFLFEIEPDQGKLTSVVMKDNLAEPQVHVPNELTTHPTLMLDSDFISSANSLPRFETFYLNIKEKNCGNTTIHADISLPDLECFNFDFKPDP